MWRGIEEEKQREENKKKIMLGEILEQGRQFSCTVLYTHYIIVFIFDFLPSKMVIFVVRK